MYNIKTIVNIRSLVGENPIWDHKNNILYWIDCNKPKIYKYNPFTKKSIAININLNVQTGSIYLHKLGLIVAKKDGLFLYNKSKNNLTLLKSYEMNKDTCFNDGILDKKNRLWIGNLHIKEKKPIADFCLIEKNKKTIILDSNYVVSNGPTITKDYKNIYISNTFKREIYIFDLNFYEGKIFNKRIFKKFTKSDGYPDGLIIDSNNCLWCSFWNGWKIECYNQKGKIIEKIFFPVPNITKCCFGGEKLNELYVTSASFGMSKSELKEAPLSGSLFKINTSYKGIKSNIANFNNL